MEVKHFQTTSSVISEVHIQMRKHTPDPASICPITQQPSKCLIEMPLISQNPGRMCSPSCAPQSCFHFELDLSKHLKMAREKMLMKSKNG